MEKRKLVKPQNTETVENVAVYACETNGYCPTNDEPGCGIEPNFYFCGGKCDGPPEINFYYCGNGCSS